MKLEQLKSIIVQQGDLKICSVCGLPYKPYHSRQKTCGDPECKKLHHQKYLRERRNRLREEDIEAFREKHRTSQQKWRKKQRELEDRNRQLEELHERWKRQEELEAIVHEYDGDYGARQRQKTLESIPKIDTTLGGKK